jgi:alkylation response protein AidB-like acyl-CoA dehydrogenase
MNLTLSDEELEIANLAADVLVNEYPLDRFHRADPDAFGDSARQLLAEQGWFGLTLDADLGGAGFSIVEELLVFREIGRGLGPVNTLPVALAARIAAAAGNTELAGKLVAGEIGVALIVDTPKGAAHTGSASKHGAEGRMRAIATRDATLALLCGPESARLLTVTSDGVEPLLSLDKSVSAGLLRQAQPAVVAEARGAQFEQVGELLTAAMLLGIAEGTRDAIVEYAKQRQTFGKPIGAYQAVRHPCADMAVKCEVAKCQLLVAAVSVRDGKADAGLQVDSAKILANAAALHNVDWNIQLHGGIGVMDEYAAHLYMKRAQVLIRCFGNEKTLLDRIARAPVAA